MTPGVYAVTRGAERLQEIRSARRARRGRRAPRRSTFKLEVGGLTESVTVSAEAPLVDTTSKEIGGRISGAGVRRHAVVQPQLRRLPRHAAGRRGDDFGDHLRRRLDQRRRSERPQRQLHDGRVEQQRHVQRRQRRRAGARAGRSGAGVPAAHQPVRRRVRPRLGRHRQLGVEAGHQPVPRQRVRLLPGSRSSPPTSTSPRRRASKRRRSKQQQLGGALGGPIVRDKAHYLRQRRAHPARRRR